MTPSSTEDENKLPSIHANEVKGLYCPACGHPTLMIFDGYITCTLAECPNPDYAEALEAYTTTERRKAADEATEPPVDLNDHKYMLQFIDDPILKFNTFLYKWCPHYSHLIDSDDNDGQKIRDMIKRLKGNN